MNAYRIYFFILVLLFSQLSCDKKDPALDAKNKALKEKVALEMQKKVGSEKPEKAPLKKKTKKKNLKDEISANAKALIKTNNKDEEKLKDKDEIVQNKPIRKEAKPEKVLVKKSPKRIKLKSAVIQIVANFDDADATINGIPYPEYTLQGEAEGMILPAGGPYSVEVKFGSNTKYYQIYLRPNETRLLFVSSSGKGGVSRPEKRTEKKKKKEIKTEKKDNKKDKIPGKVTAYGKPKGTIIVDGKTTSDKTPATIELSNGRHEIQVKYDESGQTSEKKIVRVRNGSKIKIFFREKKKK